MNFTRLNPFIPKASVYRYPNGIFELQLHLFGTVFEVEIVPHTDRLVVSGRVHTSASVKRQSDLVWTDSPAGWFGKDIPLKLNPGTECVILEKKQINEKFIVTYTLRNIRIARQASIFDGYRDDHDFFSSDPCAGLYVPAQETDAHFGLGLPYSYTGHQNSSQHHHPSPEHLSDHNCFPNGSASLNMFQDRFSTPPGYDCQACYAVPFGNVTSETYGHQHDGIISNLCGHAQTVWRYASDGVDSYDGVWYSSTSQAPLLSLVEIPCAHGSRAFESQNLVNRGQAISDTQVSAGETVAHREPNVAVQGVSNAQPASTIATHRGDVLTSVQGSSTLHCPPAGIQTSPANSRPNQAAIIAAETRYGASHEPLASSNYEHIQPQSVNGVTIPHGGSGRIADIPVDSSTVGCDISSNERNVGAISQSFGVPAIHSDGSTHVVLSGTETKRGGKTVRFDIAEGRSEGARIHDSGHVVSSGLSAGKEDVTVMEGSTGGSSYTTTGSSSGHNGVIVADAHNSSSYRQEAGVIYENHDRNAKATWTEDHLSSERVQVVNQSRMHVEASLSAGSVTSFESNAQELHHDGIVTNTIQNPRVHPAILTPGGEPSRAVAAEVEGRITFVDQTQVQQHTAVGVTPSGTIPPGAVQGPSMLEHNAYSTPGGSGPIPVGGLVPQGASHGPPFARPSDSSAGVPPGSTGSQVPVKVLPTGSDNITMGIPPPSQVPSTASHHAQSMQVPTSADLPAGAPKHPSANDMSSSSSSSSSTSTSPSLSTVGTTANKRPSQGVPAQPTTAGIYEPSVGGFVTGDTGQSDGNVVNKPNIAQPSFAGGFRPPALEPTGGQEVSGAYSHGLASEYYNAPITDQSTAHANGSQLGMSIQDGAERSTTIARSEGSQSTTQSLSETVVNPINVSHEGTMRDHESSTAHSIHLDSEPSLSTTAVQYDSHSRNETQRVASTSTSQGGVGAMEEYRVAQGRDDGAYVTLGTTQGPTLAGMQQSSAISTEERSSVVQKVIVNIDEFNTVKENSSINASSSTAAGTAMDTSEHAAHTDVPEGQYLAVVPDHGEAMSSTAIGQRHITNEHEVSETALTMEESEPLKLDNKRVRFAGHTPYTPPRPLLEPLESAVDSSTNVVTVLSEDVIGLERSESHEDVHETTTTGIEAVHDTTSGESQMGAIITAETAAVHVSQDVAAGSSSTILEQEQSLVTSHVSSSSSSRTSQEERSSASYEQLDANTEAVVVGETDASTEQYSDVPKHPTQMVDTSVVPQQLIEGSPEIHGTAAQQTLEYATQSSMQEGISSSTSATTNVEAKVQEAVTTSIISAAQENAAISLSQTESVEGQQLSTGIMTDMGQVKQVAASTSESAQFVSGESILVTSNLTETETSTGSNPPQISLEDSRETVAKDESASLDQPEGLRADLSRSWVSVSQPKSNESQQLEQSEAGIISSDNRAVEPLQSQETQAVEEQTSTSTTTVDVQHSALLVSTSSVVQTEPLSGAADHPTAMEASDPAGQTPSMPPNGVEISIAISTAEPPSPQDIIMATQAAVDDHGAAEATNESASQENGTAAMTSRDSAGISKENENHEFVQEKSEVDTNEVRHVEPEIGHVESEVEHVESEVEHVESEVEHVESEVKHMESEVQHMESEVKHVESEVKHVESETKAEELATRDPPITEMNGTSQESHEPIIIDPDKGVVPSMQDEQTSNERENTTTVKAPLGNGSDLAQTLPNIGTAGMESFATSYHMPESLFSNPSGVSTPTKEAENADKSNLDSSQTMLQQIEPSVNTTQAPSSHLPNDLEDRDQSFQDPSS